METTTSKKWVATLGVILVSLASSAIFVLLRVEDLGVFSPFFSGACDRIRDSGLLDRTMDWWCFQPAWHFNANYMFGALTIAIGLAFPTAILAATGRRWTALLPLLAAPFGVYVLNNDLLFWNTGPRDYLVHPDAVAAGVICLIIAVVIGVTLHRRSLHLPRGRVERIASIVILTVIGVALLLGLWWQTSFASNVIPFSALFALLVDLVLVAAPAVAIAGIVGRKEVHLPDARTRDRVVAGAICFVGALGLLLVLLKFHTKLEDTLNFIGPTDGWRSIGSAVPSVIIGLFAALLGTNRRWWPWTIVVTAFFLSQGLSLMVLFRTSPDVIQSIPTMFGMVLPLAAIGMIGSAWQPLSARLGRRAMPSPEEPTKILSAPVRQRRIRPVVWANTFAACLLLLSMGLYLSDTVAIRIAAPLPTYLGVRNLANEARAESDLGLALEAADRYFASNGTYVGFDARAAASLEPALVWQDGASPTKIETGRTGILRHRKMAIIAATKEHLRVAAFSANQSAFCGQQTPAGATYGVALQREMDSEASIASDRLSEAIANCETTPFDARAIKTPPELECVPDTGEFLICRMVQVLVHNIMNKPYER